MLWIPKLSPNYEAQLKLNISIEIIVSISIPVSLKKFNSSMTDLKIIL